MDPNDVKLCKSFSEQIPNVVYPFNIQPVVVMTNYDGCFLLALSYFFFLSSSCLR